MRFLSSVISFIVLPTLPSSTVFLKFPNVKQRMADIARKELGQRLFVKHHSHACSFFLTGKPSAPRKLKQTLVRGKRAPFVNLTWSAPLVDGGKEVTSYVIEYKLPTVAWEKAVIEETSERMFKFEGKKAYDARVSAKNEIGAGALSEVVRIRFAGR